MGKIKKIIHELNYLKLENFLQIILFCISIPIALMHKIYVKITKKEIWLICEDKNEARDNGFCFFKYINEKQPQIESSRSQPINNPLHVDNENKNAINNSNIFELKRK